MPVTTTTKPSAPTGTSLDSSVEDEITVTWNDESTGEDGYYVYLSTDGSNFSRLATLSSNTTSYTHTGLEDGKKYWYYIAAYTDGGENAGSTVSTTTVLPAPTVNSLTYVADDELEFDFSANDDASSPTYTVEMERDGNAWSDPAGGPSNPSPGIHTYGPNAENNYERQVGIDSAFQFRVNVSTADATSSWTTSGTVYTTPIPPHNPSVSRPNANTIDISWGVETSMAGRTIIYYREDTGGGYGSWQWYDTVTGGESHVSGTYDTGNRVTATYNVGQSYQSGDVFSEDARYQFRLRHQDPSNTRNGRVTFADYGNNGNVYFEDTFEDNDLAEWTSSSLGDSNSGIVNNEATQDTGINGSEEGSYHLRLDATNTVTKNLGDLSNESDVIVKAYVAVGSADGATERGKIKWYNGTSWSNLETFGWEYNKQGWVEVTALVPSADLSTDNRVQFEGSVGGGDHFVVDRVIVSDILHEYTKPAAPTNTELDNTVVGEITGTWSHNASFNTKYIQRYGKVGGSFTEYDGLSGGPSQESNTITGLSDGERYKVQYYARTKQPRNGVVESGLWWQAYGSEVEKTTRLPDPTSLNASNVQPTSADLDWTANHNYGDQHVYRRQTGQRAGMKILGSSSDWITLPGEAFRPIFSNYDGTLFVRASVDNFFDTNRWVDMVRATDGNFRLEREAETTDELRFQGSSSNDGNRQYATSLGSHTIGSSASYTLVADGSIPETRGYFNASLESTWTPIDLQDAFREGSDMEVIKDTTWDYTIYEIAAYDRTLSLSEIESLDSGDPPSSGLRGRWTFDQKIGGATPDVSTYANDGTVNGATLVGNTPTEVSGSLTRSTTTHNATLSSADDHELFVQAETEHSVARSNVPYTAYRTAYMDGTGNVQASRSIPNKQRAITLDGTGDVSVTRSLSEKQRSLTLHGSGDVQASRTTALVRNPTTTFESQNVVVQDLMEVWPDEEALDVSWDYDTTKMAFVSEWLDEKSHIDLSDRDGMGVDFNGGLNRAIDVWIEYDGSGNGVPDAISETKQLSQTNQTLTFSDNTMFGKDGQYRVAVHGLRVGDTINQVDIGAVHDNL